MDNPYNAPTSAVTGTVAGGRFKHPAVLTHLVRLCLVGSAVMAATTFFVSSAQRAILREGEAASLAVDDAYAEMPLHLLLAPVLQLLVLVACWVIIAMWIYRIASNTRFLAGANKMDYTPGWAVGWYFIPFANLWKPYQAMKEIWALNIARDGGSGAVVAMLLPLWWFLWLAWNFVSNAAGRMSWRATSYEQNDNALLASMTSDAIHVPLCIVLLLITNRLYTAQIRAHAARLSAGINPEAATQGFAAPAFLPVLPSSTAQESIP